MTTKIDIVSGFLGAGKTMLIKKLLEEQLSGEKIVLIENEFGEIGIDGNLFKSAGIEIREINAGCICCTLIGDFSTALKEVLHRFTPDRILIEPSGVGKLSEVLQSCRKISQSIPIQLNMCITVVDALKYTMYSRNFAEFFDNQLVHAKTILLSRTQKLDTAKLQAVVDGIRKRNPNANIITTPWDQLVSSKILSVAERIPSDSLETQLTKLVKVKRHTCSCSDSHDSHHHCTCGEKHHADEVFGTWGQETPHIFTMDTIHYALDHLLDTARYGTIIRAKGIVPLADQWIQFDYVPGEIDIKPIEPDYTGRLCVIGTNINPDALSALFFNTNLN